MTPIEYKLLRDGLSRCASGFLSLRRTIENDDPTIAAEVAAVFEEFACGLHDRLPESLGHECPECAASINRLRTALQAALVVVSGCNADGLFNTEEAAIRAVLAWEAQS